MATRPKRKPKIGDAHVRLYGYELNSPAYRTLNVDARALLIEFRALFSGGENRIFLSLRQMMVRLGIGQRRAEHARDALLERGWIRVIELGGFSRKTKIATVYALMNEPLENRDGTTAPKDYMRWQPSGKFTVAAMNTDGSCHSYSEGSEDTQNAPNGSCHSYRKPKNGRSTVAATATQIQLPRVLRSRDAPMVRQEPGSRSQSRSIR